jgi:hypothetical protein
VKKLFSFMAAIMLAFSVQATAPASVSADQQCAHTKVRLFEDINRGGDSIDLCGNINDLNNVTHTQSGNCGGAIIGDNSWDDCASSWQVIENDHSYCIQIWANPLSFGAGKIPLLEGGFRAAGYWSNFDSGENDSATSIEWQNTTSCATNN